MDDAPTPTAPFAPPTGLTPPTEPGGKVAGPVSLWPNVIGALCIVCGVSGALFYGWLVIAPFVTRDWSSSPVGHEPRGEKWLWIVSGSVGLILAVDLLASGIGLARRRSWSISALQFWAVLKMFVVLVYSVFSYFMYSGIEQLGAGASTPTAGEHTLGVVISFIWGCLLPVFVLIWLSRRSIRQETESWQTSGSTS